MNSESYHFGREAGWETFEILKKRYLLTPSLQEILTTESIARCCVEFAVCVHGLFGTIDKDIATTALIDEMAQRTLEPSGNMPSQIFIDKEVTK